METMRFAYLSNPLMLESTLIAVSVQEEVVETTPLGGILPDAVRGWLARLRLLEGVPFAHLVPDSELLPLEAIRFFYLDREWTDALIQGTLSVGTVNSLDREDLQALYRRIRDEIDTEERKVRLVGSDPPGTAPADTISGFLLRSRVVSGWPALHVRGYKSEIGPDDVVLPEDDPRRLRLLRLERLAPAVLLCLFDGIPEVVHIEEPRQGIQFGVNLKSGPQGVTQVKLPLRDVNTGERLDQQNPRPSGALDVTVPFRSGAPGVINVAELARRIAAQPATHVNDFEGTGVQSAEFALEMLRFPYRQVFGDQSLGGGGGNQPPIGFADLFRPQVAIEVLRAWNAGEQP